MRIRPVNFYGRYYLTAYIDRARQLDVCTYRVCPEAIRGSRTAPRGAHVILDDFRPKRPWKASEGDLPTATVRAIHRPPCSPTSPPTPQGLRTGLHTTGGNLNGESGRWMTWFAEMAISANHVIGQVRSLRVASGSGGRAICGWFSSTISVLGYNAERAG